MPNSFHLEGVEALDKHDYQTAKTLFLQAIENNPEEADSYLLLGKSCFFSDEKGEAIAYLKKYIEMNQHNSNEIANVSYAFDLLGQCYEAEKKDNAALTCYTTATRMNPLAASAWHNLGLFYIKSAQHYLDNDLTNSFKIFLKAQISLKKALEICSNMPMFLHSMAGWYEKYIEALKKIADDEEAAQKNIDNHFQLAIQYYQKAFAACHEDDTALKNIITLNLTECLAQYGHYFYRADNFVKAIAFYLQALQLDSEHVVVINQIGMSLFKQKQFPEAREYFLDILNKTSDSQELADAWLNIACTHRMEKSWINAEDAIKEARKLAPEDSSIVDEEKKLMTSKAQASLIAAPQPIFATPNLHAESSQEACSVCMDDKHFTV